jgi:formylglycine-generating enzyme required for sulfatase activity
MRPRLATRPGWLGLRRTAAPTVHMLLRFVALILIAVVLPAAEALAAGAPAGAGNDAAPHPPARPPTFKDCPDEHRCPLLVRLSGATFTMGSPKNESGRMDDEDQRQVAVKPFAIAAWPVTRDTGQTTGY